MEIIEQNVNIWVSCSTLSSLRGTHFFKTGSVNDKWIRKEYIRLGT